MSSWVDLQNKCCPSIIVENCMQHVGEGLKIHVQEEIDYLQPFESLLLYTQKELLLHPEYWIYMIHYKQIIIVDAI